MPRPWTGIEPRKPGSGIQAKTAPENAAARKRSSLALLALVDLLDHLGHVVLVLAQLRGVFQHLLFLLGCRLL